MAEQDYQVKDPEGNIRVIRGPAGASDDEVIAKAKSLFETTPGGAATGNPLLRMQGEKMLSHNFDYGPALKIGGATLFGGASGAFLPEILNAGAQAAGAFPLTAPLSGPLRFMAGASQAAGRPATAIAGAIGGGASETAGQLAEAAGAGPVTAEGARLIAGGVTPEFANLAKTAIGKYLATPALSFFSKMKKEGIKGLMETMTGAPVKLSEAQEKYLEEQIAALRGGVKTDAPLEAVGNVLEESGAKGVVQGARATTAAAQQTAALGPVAPLPQRDYGEIGSTLRETITKRNEEAIKARAAQYAATQQARDAVVSSKEAAGQTIQALPEYQQVMADLTEQLAPGKRSLDVQRGIAKVLEELKTPGARFQAIDDVRRKLGEVFRGKPAEGYDAIDAGLAKNLYGRLSDIQKKYAGSPQEKLLEDYANATEGLDVFRSKAGRKATALDKYDESQFATDAAALPKTYFKSRESIQALKELTGSDAAVNRAAMEYANRELQDASGPEIRRWMGKNHEWLDELPSVQRLIINHAQKVESAERATKQASQFATEMGKRNDALLGGTFGAQRVKNLVSSGNADLWSQAGPAIAASPEGRQHVLDAVRQVVADKAEGGTRGLVDFFARKVRPALEQSRLADKSAMDEIASRLSNIENMNVPEPQKLGFMRSMILHTLGGYSASVTARAGVALGVPQ